MADDTLIPPINSYAPIPSRPPGQGPRKDKDEDAQREKARRQRREKDQGKGSHIDEFA